VANRTPLAFSAIRVTASHRLARNRRASTVELDVDGVKLSGIQAIPAQRGAEAAHYWVLDACRNTLRGTRGGKGFVPIGQQSGVLVVFAAEPDP
jgi:poly(3-hydroxybutyrate) depolymerase